MIGALLSIFVPFLTTGASNDDRVEDSSPTVYMCTLQDRTTDPSKSADKHKLAVQVRTFKSLTRGSFYTVEVADPDAVIVGAPLTKWTFRDLNGPNGPSFMISAESWPSANQALGLRPYTPRRFEKFAGGKNEVFDAALLSGTEPLKLGFCFIGSGDGAVGYFNQLKNKGQRAQ